jgi:hypothetical protein
MNRERRCSLTKRAGIFLNRNFRRPIKPNQVLPHSAFPGWPAMSEAPEAGSNGRMAIYPVHPVNPELLMVGPIER